MRRAAVPTALLLIGTVPCLPAAAVPFFQGLGTIPGTDMIAGTASAVSADGRVVVGTAYDLVESQAFVWTLQGGLVGIGDLPDGATQANAQDVSADGRVVVGYASSAAGVEAFRWTEAGGMVGLDDLPGGGFESWAQSVSADGSVVIGFGSSGTGSTRREAFRWTQADGMVGLGRLAGYAESGAVGVSSDGSVFAGNSVGPSSSDHEAMVWTEASGWTGLGSYPGWTGGAQAYGISADGSVVVGRVPTPSGNQAMRWSAGSGFLALGDLAGGTPDASTAYATTPDGGVIVGSALTSEGDRAFVWSAADGIRAIDEVLTSEFGLDLGGWVLTAAADISADGLTIVGYGQNPDGQTEAWVAVIPEPTSGLLLGGGLVVLGRRTRRRKD